MKKFIAYFDYLGYKQFIDNNDLEYQKNVVNNIFRDMGLALSNKKTVPTKHPYIVAPDLSVFKINAINFSDTIVFWTNDDTEESLKEILNVAFQFNSSQIMHCFPVRGCVVYGELEYIDFKQKNDVGGMYNVNSVFGKGLVDAHLKAEAQNWAGTIIDESVIGKITEQNWNLKELIDDKAVKYKVPYKKPLELPDEYVMKLLKGGKLPEDRREKAILNYSKSIRDNFASHKKSLDNADVQEKIKNTIAFLEYDL